MDTLIEPILGLAVIIQLTIWALQPGYSYNKRMKKHKEKWGKQKYYIKEKNHNLF